MAPPCTPFAFWLTSFEKESTPCSDVGPKQSRRTVSQFYSFVTSSGCSWWHSWCQQVLMTFQHRERQNLGVSVYEFLCCVSVCVATPM
mmetsp:Transcript_43178/g.65352  ORF Transcript_43178/g.65352 Transcript_43178/m.65352 type:complete len:88 (-) Transcript_43178:276-539(-)